MPSTLTPGLPRARCRPCARRPNLDHLRREPRARRRRRRRRRPTSRPSTSPSASGAAYVTSGDSGTLHVQDLRRSRPADDTDPDGVLQRAVRLRPRAHRSLDAGNARRARPPRRAAARDPGRGLLPRRLFPALPEVLRKPYRYRRWILRPAGEHGPRMKRLLLLSLLAAVVVAVPAQAACGGSVPRQDLQRLVRRREDRLDLPARAATSTRSSTSRPTRTSTRASARTSRPRCARRSGMRQGKAVPKQVGHGFAAHNVLVPRARRRRPQSAPRTIRHVAARPGQDPASAVRRAHAAGCGLEQRRAVAGARSGWARARTRRCRCESARASSTRAHGAAKRRLSRARSAGR